MKLAILVGSILCLLSFPSAVFAQSASVSGDIRGTITDPSGAVLAKVTVTALDPQTGLHRAAVSDANGQFRLAVVPITRKRRRMSAAAIARIRAAQKARWAKWRKQRTA